jgi:hypothetical protein
MASNIQFTEEVSSAVPVATAPGKARLFKDQADGLLKLKDHLGAVYPVAGVQDWKDAVRMASVAALPAYTRLGNVITANAFGLIPDIDGVTPDLNDSFLLLNGASDADNGVWTITQLGSGSLPFIMERRGDMANSAQISPGMVVGTGPEGGTNNSTLFILASPAPIVLNTTPLLFTPISGEGGAGGYSLYEVIDEQLIPERQDMLYTDDVLVTDDGGGGYGNLLSEGNVTPARTEDNFSVLYIPPRSRRVVQENDQMPYTSSMVIDGVLVVDGDIIDVTPYDGFDIFAALEFSYPGTKYMDEALTTSDATPTTIFSYTTGADNRIITFDLFVNAQSNNNNDVAAFMIAAVFHRGSGVATVVNRDVNYVNGPYRDLGATAWNVTFNIPGGGPVINVHVTGDAGESIDWRVTGKVVENG